MDVTIAASAVESGCFKDVFVIAHQLSHSFSRASLFISIANQIVISK